MRPNFADSSSFQRDSEKRPERTGPEHYERKIKAMPKKLPTTKRHRTTHRAALRLQSPPVLVVPQQTDWKSKLEIMAQACSEEFDAVALPEVSCSPGLF